MEQGLCREERRRHIDVEHGVAPVLRNPLGLAGTSSSHTTMKSSDWVEIPPDTARDVLEEFDGTSALLMRPSPSQREKSAVGDVGVSLRGATERSERSP